MVLAVAAAGWAVAAEPVRTAGECAAAVDADPEAAREAAAVWARHGGGAEARLCEAAALEAMGATGTAAVLLTRLGQDRTVALGPDIRAVILRDGARLWLEAEEPGLARDALAAAGRLAPWDRLALEVEARAAAALGDWEGARAAVGAVLEADPDDAGARALLAAALRLGGEPEAALAEARRALAGAPELAEARFEEAAALAELGRRAEAIAGFLDLAAAAPGHDLAPLAAANARRLAAPD